MTKGVDVGKILKGLQADMEKEGKDTALVIAKEAGRLLGGVVGTIFGAGVLAAKATGRGAVSLAGKIKGASTSLSSYSNDELKAFTIAFNEALKSADSDEVKVIEVAMKAIEKERIDRIMASTKTQRIDELKAFSILLEETIKDADAEDIPILKSAIKAVREERGRRLMASMVTKK